MTRLRRGRDCGSACARRRGWADAASYTFGDFRMLRKEMTAGYLVAGFLAVLVPVSVWNSVFVTGHGFWTSLQNVIVGPFIAIIASSARSGTCRSPRRSGTAGSASAA